MKTKLFEPEHLIWALRESAGVISEAARLLGCSLGTIQRYRAEYEEVAAEFDMLKRRRGDWVVGKLLEHIENGNVASAIFYLKTQEGWSEYRNLNINKQISFGGGVSISMPEKAEQFLKFEKALELIGGEVIEGELLLTDGEE